MEKNTKINGFFNRLFNSQMARPMARSQQYPHAQLNNEKSNLAAHSNLQPHEQEELNGIEKDAILKVISHIKSQSEENNRYEYD